jgi:hypothetical protein
MVVESVKGWTTLIDELVSIVTVAPRVRGERCRGSVMTTGHRGGPGRQ